MEDMLRKYANRVISWKTSRTANGRILSRGKFFLRSRRTEIEANYLKDIWIAIISHFPQEKEGGNALVDDSSIRFYNPAQGGYQTQKPFPLSLAGEEGAYSMIKMTIS
ncbi:MAG TPA: hypothetical protein VGO57_07895 [Verrucomicrobiae bacterium]|jgi:hypothetical protein